MLPAGRFCDRAQVRLALALGASVVVHTALMQAVEGTVTKPAHNTTTKQLAAELIFPRSALSELASDRPMARKSQARQDEHTATPPTHRVPPAPAPHPTESATRPSPSGDAVLTPVSDPTYYSARNLDVYPRALTPLDLNTVAGAGAGRLRATLFIDESGNVNEVRAIETSNNKVEDAAREMLMRTLFSPARKDGRVVKAQVVVSLE